MQNSTPTAIVENAWTASDIALRTLNNILTSLNERLPNILAGILVLLLFWIFSKIFSWIFWSVSGRTKIDYRLRLLFGRLIFLTIFIIGFFTSLVVIIPTFKFSDLITGLGFTSFIVGFATKDILNNLLSGVLILWRQPFRIGDYVSVGGNQGKVEFIGIRATQLRKDDGEMILIPNGDMYSTALTIRNAGAERRMSLKFNIGYDVDSTKAKQIAKEALIKTDGISKEKEPNVFVTDLSVEGMTISCFFWVKTEVYNPLQVFDEAATNVKESLEKAGIKIFPK